MTILLCTSLRPSPRTRTFCNDLVSATADFNYYLRGKSSLLLLSAYTHSTGADRLWIVNSRFGDPKLIECYDTGGGKAKKIGSLLISRVILRRELKGLSQKTARGRHLRLFPPEDRALTGLYEMLLNSVGELAPSDRGVTELRIEASRDHFAEVLFIESETKAPCGPKILLKDFKG
jgi:rRNA maturation protein Rpf1